MKFWVRGSFLPWVWCSDDLISRENSLWGLRMSDFRWRKGRKRGHVLSSTSAVSPAIPLILPFLTKIIEFYWDTSVSFIWFWFIADQSDIPRQIGIPNAMIKILEIFCFCWCWCTWLLNKIIINIQRTEKYSTAMCQCTSMYFDVLRCTSQACKPLRSLCLPTKCKLEALPLLLNYFCGIRKIYC